LSIGTPRNQFRGGSSLDMFLEQAFVDTRGGTHRKDRKGTVVRVAFHEGVILGIESTRNKE